MAAPKKQASTKKQAPKGGASLGGASQGRARPDEPKSKPRTEFTVLSTL